MRGFKDVYDDLLAIRRLNFSLWHLRRANGKFAEGVSADMRVLDAGAGEQPYRHLFDHARYESADLNEYEPPATYVCDLTAIPVEGGRFDRVMCNQVLEHLPRPRAALIELHRVLKPGGRILLTCPFFYAEHFQPHDYYRYTQFGLRHLFETAGFSVISIEPLEGWFGTMGYMFRTMYTNFRILPQRFNGAAVWLVWPLVVLPMILAGGLATVLSLLDIPFRVTVVGFPKNYAIIAERPVS